MNDQSPLSEAELSKLADIPAIRITMQHQLHDKLVLGFETHVLAQCPKHEFDDRLDKLRQAAERQRAIANLPTVRGMLQDKRAGYDKEKDNLLSYEAEAQVLAQRWNESHAASGRRGPIRDTPQYANARTQLEAKISGARQNLNILIKEISIFERQIAEMEKIAGGADAADREPAGL